MNATIIQGLASADELLARRSEIAKKLAPLRALYGGNGYTGERQFKMHEAAIALRVRAEFQEQSIKATEAMIDAKTRDDKHYEAYLLDDIAQRTSWVELEEELNYIDWQLKCRNTDAYLLGAEARLQ